MDGGALWIIPFAEAIKTGHSQLIELTTNKNIMQGIVTAQQVKQPLAMPALTIQLPDNDPARQQMMA